MTEKHPTYKKRVANSKKPPINAGADVFDLTGLRLGEVVNEFKGLNSLDAQFGLAQKVLKALLEKMDYFPITLLSQLTGQILSHKMDILKIEKSVEAKKPKFER